jgi:hypothetical protein
MWHRSMKCNCDGANTTRQCRCDGMGRIRQFRSVMAHRRVVWEKEEYAGVHFYYLLTCNESSNSPWTTKPFGGRGGRR